MKSLLKNKKADFQSLIVGIIVVFGLALGVILFSKVFIAVTDELKTQEDFSNTTINTIESTQSKTIPLLDFFIFFTLVSIMIGLIVASIYIDVHPALVVVFMIGLVIAVFFSGIFSNVYSEFSSDSEISSTASQFKFTNLILGEHFPIIISVLGVIIIIILYGKSRRGGLEVV
ncbi:MAG: hypothetical protein ACTSPV_01175 [Candidatus Hodarchaeales archaeon]